MLCVDRQLVFKGLLTYFPTFRPYGLHNHQIMPVVVQQKSGSVCRRIVQVNAGIVAKSVVNSTRRFVQSVTDLIGMLYHHRVAFIEMLLCQFNCCRRRPGIILIEFTVNKYLCVVKNELDVIKRFQ